MSADAAFAQLLEDVVPTGWSVDRRSGASLVLRCSCALGGALLHARLRPPDAARRGRRGSRSGAVEARIALGALVALFAAFVALQFATLFGGKRHVLDTAGLTYAEYARSGFAQLLAVAALTFAVIAAARRWAPTASGCCLLAALCLLTLVVLASALKRLGLYEETYGFTRLRFAAHAALLYLGALFCLVLVARSRGLAAAGGRGRHRRRACCCSRSPTPSAGSPSTTSTATSAPARSTSPTSTTLGRGRGARARARAAGAAAVRRRRRARRASTSRGPPRDERVLTAEQQLQRVAILGVPAGDARRRRRRAC